MNRMKKFASLVLALVMALALAVPAFASEGDLTITIQNTNTGHTYGAYQIFTGTVSENGKTLSDIEWGANIDAANQAKLISDLSLPTDASAEDVAGELAEVYEKRGPELADLLNGYITGDPVASADAPVNGDYTMEVAPGYYLIKDMKAVTGNDTATDFILEIVGDATVAPKSSGQPTPDKNVKDTNDSTGDPADAWGKSADHDVGDTIEYQLSAVLPDSYPNYKQYKLQFVDTFSTGLTIEAKDVNVYLVNKNGETETKTLITPNEVKVEDQTLTVTFDDLKKNEAVVAGSKILVEYTATLNDNAVFKNENTMHLVFSNDPNWDGEGKPPTGTSPDVTAVVFTYNPVVNKVDQDGKALAGAMFTLSKWDATTQSWVAVKGKENFKLGETTTFKFKGVDDGIYKLEETTVPDGYNKAADIYFEVVADHENKDSAPEVYGGTFDEEAKSWARGDKKDSFVFEVNEEIGTVTTKVENRPGSLLPETGGIGTTIFYVLGGLLTLGAVVLLVTKKRMSLEEK